MQINYNKGGEKILNYLLKSHLLRHFIRNNSQLSNYAGSLKLSCRLYLQIVLYYFTTPYGKYMNLPVL